MAKTVITVVKQLSPGYVPIQTLCAYTIKRTRKRCYYRTLLYTVIECYNSCKLLESTSKL